MLLFLLLYSRARNKKTSALFALFKRYNTREIQTLLFTRFEEETNSVVNRIQNNQIFGSLTLKIGLLTCPFTRLAIECECEYWFKITEYESISNDRHIRYWVVKQLFNITFKSPSEDLLSLQTKLLNVLTSTCNPVGKRTLLKEQITFYETTGSRPTWFFLLRKSSFFGCLKKENLSIEFVKYF